MASNLVFTWQAYVGLNHWALTRQHHRGELHRRDRHRDLRRLPVGALQIAAAHRDAIRAADRARRRSAAPISRPAPASSPSRNRLGAVLRHQRSGCDSRACCCCGGCRCAAISRRSGRQGLLRATISECLVSRTRCSVSAPFSAKRCTADPGPFHIRCSATVPVLQRITSPPGGSCGTARCRRSRPRPEPRSERDAASSFFPRSSHDRVCLRRTGSHWELYSGVRLRIAADSVPSSR